jgi:heat shock protein beta
LRNAKEVAKEDYNTFYKSTFKEFIDPQAYTHFSTEGEIEFKSLLFIPGMAPFNSEDMLNGKTKNIRLYVKRVFISDEFDGELFPRYLGFVKGVVDSNDLPLNVSREILQESRIVRIMKKRLVRKTFDMIEEISKRENKEDYKQFWSSYGKNMKLGCIEDTTNHKRLAPLLRFNSSKNEEEMISLDQYVEGMNEDQKAIYYLAADTVKSAKSAPFLEELVQRDIEVLFLVEPIDEVAITNLQSYKDKKFVDISKEDLELGDIDEDKEKENEKEYRLLCDWMKQNLGDKVAKVAVSKRISSSPCVLVSGKFGWSANMERIMKAQTLGDTTQMEFMRGRRILEINPTHPIIQDLNFACKDTPRSSRAQAMVNLLYETALLSSGFTPENPAEFGARVYEMMGLALAGKNNAQAKEKVEGQGQKQTEEPSSDASETPSEVVEASEVITENDPWQS